MQLKEFSTDNLRNVCLAGQRGCGKTSLADAIAFAVGVNNRIGRVDDGSSFFDYTEAEIARKSSITSKLLASTWQNVKLNLLDCPGHADFIGELLTSIKVCDTVGVVIDAAAGAEIGTQLQWKAMSEKGISRFFFVNKTDKENVKWGETLDSIKAAFGSGVTAIQLPIGEGTSFKGIVDLLGMKAYSFEDGKRSEIDIPADLKADAEAYRESLMEVAAESDDALMEKFFDQGELDAVDFKKGLRAGILKGTLFPVLFGSMQLGIGVETMLDFVADYLPSPDQMPPLEAFKTGTDEATEVAIEPATSPLVYVYKTLSEGHLGEMAFYRTITGCMRPGSELLNQQTGATERLAQSYSIQGKNRIDIPSVPAGDIGVAVKLKNTHTGNTLSSKGQTVSIKPAELPNPVMDVAISPKSKGDEEKVAAGLTKLGEEDQTFTLIADPALRQQVLYAQGSTHIEVLMEKLQSRFGVEVQLTKPKIPYRETVMGKAEKRYKHKKQSGGRGQYGDVNIRIEPNARGGGFEFLDEIKGGVVPSKFIPAVEKGIQESMVKGGLCGAPVVDVKVALFFGSYHDVDSSDMAFKIAGSMAFREGYLDSKPVILEPIYNIEVLVPDEFTGDVMGDLSSRRGKIAGMDPEGGSQRIRAAVPRSELYQYSVDLRSMTQGQGFYTMEFSHYENVPHEISLKIQEEAKAEKEAEG
ncbi:MAG: elongation factor G [Candidatus Zixiibacteriota bacterium]|nr:MAG: elongation factor G [candidate division Zixibacteria bacterium]